VKPICASLEVCQASGIRGKFGCEVRLTLICHVPSCDELCLSQPVAVLLVRRRFLPDRPSLAYGSRGHCSASRKVVRSSCRRARSACARLYHAAMHPYSKVSRQTRRGCDEARRHRSGTPRTQIAIAMLTMNDRLCGDSGRSDAGTNRGRTCSRRDHPRTSTRIVRQCIKRGEIISKGFVINRSRRYKMYLPARLKNDRPPGSLPGNSHITRAIHGCSF
jgi:hypothetical protein